MSSRRKKGSNRRRKAVTLLAKAHQTVRRQRQDFHHKTALALVRENDTIYHEDLQTANMVKNHHLAKSISDAGWAAFLSILTLQGSMRRYASSSRVNPAYTSQTCSGCGVLVQKGLSVRWHRLPGLRNEPASRPQRGAEHPAAGARAEKSAGIRPSGVNVAGCRMRSLRSPGFSRGSMSPIWRRSQRPRSTVSATHRAFQRYGMTRARQAK